MKLPTSGQVAAASGDNAVSELHLTPTDGILSLTTSERMLKWHAEAVGRMVDLSAPGDVYDCFSLSSPLLSAADFRLVFQQA